MNQRIFQRDSNPRSYIFALQWKPYKKMIDSICLSPAHFNVYPSLLLKKETRKNTSYHLYHATIEDYNIAQVASPSNFFVSCLLFIITKSSQVGP